MSWTHPAFGSWYYADGDTTLPKHIHTATEFVVTSKSLGGHWCPYCHEKGKFTWISTYRCVTCDRLSGPNEPEVKELMKKY